MAFSRDVRRNFYLPSFVELDFIFHVFKSREGMVKI